MGTEAIPGVTRVEAISRGEERFLIKSDVSGNWEISFSPRSFFGGPTTFVFPRRNMVGVNGRDRDYFRYLEGSKRMMMIWVNESEAVVIAPARTGDKLVFTKIQEPHKKGYDVHSELVGASDRVYDVA